MNNELAQGTSRLRARIDATLERSFDPSNYHGQRVTIAVPDATRPLSYTATLGPLLARLRDAGARHIELLVALGLHRPMTANELTELHDLGARFGAALSQSEAKHDDTLITLSEDVELVPGERERDALPSILHHAVVETDRVICTGLVEPHQYAGFSGGVKTIAIGCAGARTISALHGLTYLRDPNTTLGSVESNPFRRALERVIAPLAPPIDALQVVPTSQQELFFGPVNDVFPRAARAAARGCFERHDRTYGWVHLQVPQAKATNFYQASRAATYVSLIQPSVVRPGGTLFVSARCEEGIGDGAGERACAALLRKGKDALLREFYERIDPILDGGEQRAYIVARALEHHDIVLIGARALPELSMMGIESYPTLEHALEARALDPTDGAMLDDVFHKVPVHRTLAPRSSQRQRDAPSASDSSSPELDGS